MYNYKNRYYVQANLRADGSSRFAKGHRWGWFPSASIGWVMSNESWMQDIDPVTYLKLRASIGTLGNERIGNYPWQTSVSFNNALFVDSTGKTITSQMTAAQVDLAVKDITWERWFFRSAGVFAAGAEKPRDHRAHPDTQGQLLSLRHDKGADGGGRIRFSSRL